MQTFTIGWPRRWPLQGFGRNELLRLSDRVESIVVIIFGTLAIVAIPFVVAVGVSVHDYEIDDQARQTASLHQTTATVYQEPTASNHYLFGAVWSVPVRWDVAGSERVGTIDRDVKSEVGESVPVWIDRQGLLSHAPAVTGSATADAVGVAIVVWLAAVGVSGGIAQLIRWRLDLSRFAKWDRELRSLADDGGGRTRR